MRLLFLLLLGCPAKAPEPVEPVVQQVAAPLPTSLPALRKQMEPIAPQVGLVEMTWSGEVLRARAVWTEAGQYGLVLGQQEGFRPDLRVDLGADCQLLAGDWDWMMKRLARTFRSYDVPPGAPILLAARDGVEAKAQQVAAGLRDAGYSSVLLVDVDWAESSCTEPAVDGPGLAAAQARFEAQPAATESAESLDALLKTRSQEPPDPSEGAIDP